MSRYQHEFGLLIYGRTLTEFEADWRREAVTEYGITHREYNECWPPGSRKAEWIADVRFAAKDGARIHPRVLDDLTRHAPDVYRDLYREYSIGRLPNAIPPDYLPPDVRQLNAAHERQQRAARRAGLRSSTQEEP